MESISVMENSYKELQRIKKSLLGGNSVTIEFNKLDINTAGLLKTALNRAISERDKKLYSVITNSNTMM